MEQLQALVAQLAESETWIDDDLSPIDTCVDRFRDRRSQLGSNLAEEIIGSRGTGRETDRDRAVRQPAADPSGRRRIRPVALRRRLASGLPLS